VCGCGLCREKIENGKRDVLLA